MTTWLKPTEKLLKQKKKQAAEKYLACHDLVLLPAMIDCHVHFRTPGHEQKENWQTASQAMTKGGIAAVIDMPNNSPSIVDAKTLLQKIKLVKKQLQYPVKPFFYLGATAEKLPDKKLKNQVVGLKVYMGSTTGSLLVDKDEYLEKIFKAWDGLLAFHAEDEEMIKLNERKYKNLKASIKHSQIRTPAVATAAVKRVIRFAKKYDRAVYICHVSTRAELSEIRQAKKAGVKIFAEASPHHLFLNTAFYKKLGNFLKVNPPVRSLADQKALWQAINDGTIDVLATDHAPHLPEEKKQAYDKAPSGLPEIDTFLPLMLDAVNKKKLSLKKLTELMHHNPVKIFNLKGLDNDGVIIDLKLKQKVTTTDLRTKCKWTPYENWELTGWPVATVLNHKIYLTEDI